MEDIGRIVIMMGIVLVVIGGILLLIGKVPWLGHLPGDISIQSGNLSCFFPIATSILLSIILTIVLNLFFRLLNK